jgi:pullulanase
MMSWLFRYRKAVEYYSPGSDEVSLVVDELNQSWPMKKDIHGNWTVKPDVPEHALTNLSYHFLVKEDNKVRKVIDPMAHQLRLVDGQYQSLFTNNGYTHLNKRFHAPAIDEIVIYETHLPALSRHSSAALDEEKYRGTYLGGASDFVLNYLQRLKAAVEFLPLHYRDKALGQDWGYFSVSYNAMRTDYAVNEKRTNDEVMMLIDAMHGRVMPVILDVVFNHGAELWVKAWGKDIVYRSLQDGDFCQGSGCGATIQTENRHIRKIIIKTLQHLVEHYRFDGFRFDLGALHDKKTMIEIDRQLPKRIYLIAEPWALSGAQWGKDAMSGTFAHTRWAIWNDDFRESGRTFILGHGDHHNRDRLMRAIVGSHVKDGGWALRPQQSINYLSCHDGKTLADIVAGDKRRAFLGIFLVLTSQGIPMLGEGSEMLYTKHGHDNTYDRPDLNQLDWRNADIHSDLVDAVGRLMTLRKQMNHFRYHSHVKVNNHKSDRWDIDWIYPTGYPHNDNVNAIAYIIRPPRRFSLWHKARKPLLILLNGSHEGANFQLPKGEWKVIVDGLQLKVKPFGLSVVPNAKGHYHLHPGTCAMLAPADN